MYVFTINHDSDESTSEHEGKFKTFQAGDRKCF